MPIWKEHLEPNAWSAAGRAAPARFRQIMLRRPASEYARRIGIDRSLPTQVDPRPPRRSRTHWVVVFLLTAVEACSPPQATPDPDATTGRPETRFPLLAEEGTPRAPARPPRVVLAAGGRTQRGTLVHFNWVIEGHRQRFDATRPIRWQRRLGIEAGRIVSVFKIQAKAPPQIIEIRQYQNVQESGVPRIADATRYSCSLTAIGTAAKDDCAIVSASGAWEVVVGLEPEAGTYITLYAYWFDQRQAEQGTVGPGGGSEAAWIFRL